MNHIHNLTPYQARMNVGPIGVAGHENFVAVKGFIYQQKPDYPYSPKVSV
jgi:hypothetical protein